MFALIENNQVTKVGELSVLFPNTSNPTASFASSHGAKEVVEGERKDERFYWVTFSHYDIQANKVVRTYTNTPKALDDLKSLFVGQNKSAANSLLANTDWMVIRKAERGVDIPAETVSERAQIVSDCNEKEAAINAATTVEELIAVIAPVIRQ